MVATEHHVPRYRKLVSQWFDFELTHYEKAVLLQAFPKAYELLKTDVPTLTLESDKQPKGKENVLLTITLAFLSSLSEEQQEVLGGEEPPEKGYLQAEMRDFLRLLKIATLRTQHRTAFTAH